LALEEATQAAGGGFGRTLGGAAAGAGFAGANIGAVYSNLELIREFVWTKLGLFGLEDVYLMAIALVAAAVLGYLLGALVLYFIFVRRQKFALSAAYWSLVLLLAPAIGYVTYEHVSPVHAHASIDSEADRLLQATMDQYTPVSSDRGAFRFFFEQTSETPQAWTSAEALVALLSRRNGLTPEVAAMSRHTFDYLNDVKTPDGWPFWYGDQQGVTEVGAWVVLAEVYSVHPSQIQQIWGADQAQAYERLHLHLGELVTRQHADGGWGPMNRTDDPRHLRVYSTIMAVHALMEARREPSVANDARWQYDQSIRRGVGWLLENFTSSTDGAEGWYPNPARPTQHGECLPLTAHAMLAVQMAYRDLGESVVDRATFERARTAFLNQALGGAANVPSVARRPFTVVCQLRDVDTHLPGAGDYRLEPSTYVWYPWTLMAVTELRADPTLPQAERNMVNTLELLLSQRFAEAAAYSRGDQALYVLVQVLYAANKARQEPVLANAGAAPS
jgi:hypothetical protein